MILCYPMAELNVIPPTTSLVCGTFILTCYTSGYFRGELHKEDIEIYDPGTEPEAPDPRDMIDLEVGSLWAKTIKKNTNSTQNESETHHAKQYEVTSFLSTDCELSTETCSKNVYSLGPLCFMQNESVKTLHTGC